MTGNADGSVPKGFVFLLGQLQGEGVTGFGERKNSVPIFCHIKVVDLSSVVLTW